MKESGAMDMSEEKFPDCFYKGTKNNFFCKGVCFVIKLHWQNQLYYVA